MSKFTKEELDEIQYALWSRGTRAARKGGDAEFEWYDALGKKVVKALKGHNNRQRGTRK